MHVYRLLDERFERHKDCPRLPVTAHAQRAVAAAAAGAPSGGASSARTATTSGAGGAEACAALCVGTLRCKSWSFRHSTAEGYRRPPHQRPTPEPAYAATAAAASDAHIARARGDGQSRGRALSSQSRPPGRTPSRRKNPRGSSGGGAGRRNSGSGDRHNAIAVERWGASSEASAYARPLKEEPTAFAPQCELFGFAMRGTAVGGAAAALALGLGVGARWSSGDIDRPAVRKDRCTFHSTCSFFKLAPICSGSINWRAWDCRVAPNPTPGPDVGSGGGDERDDLRGAGLRLRDELGGAAPGQRPRP